MSILDKFKQVVGDDIIVDKDLSPLTTFKIGGSAKYFYVAQNGSEIAKLIKICNKNEFPYFILGGGSDILVSDSGFNGLIIKVGNSRIKVKGDVIECGSGALLSQLIGKSVASGLVGLGWAMSIPGTVGGAIYNNAGAYGGEMKDSIDEVEVVRGGVVRRLKNKDCKFSYRYSIFQEEKNKDIILSATFKMSRGDVEAEKKNMREIFKIRKVKFSGACAGSIFKSVVMSDDEIQSFTSRFKDVPEDFVARKKIPAGWLLDQCGLRGKKIGGAQISDTHAGIIVNIGQATAQDVIILISLMKQKVRDKFGIQLHEEVIYLGF